MILQRTDDPLFLLSEQTIYLVSKDFEKDPLSSALTTAYVAHHSTNLADTLASELGVLSNSEPLLLTSLKKVPRGTNGGVSLLGMGFSAVGGGVIGVG